MSFFYRTGVRPHVVCVVHVVHTVHKLNNLSVDENHNILYYILAFVTDGQKMKYHREARANFKPTVWAVFYKSTAFLVKAVHMTWINKKEQCIWKHGEILPRENGSRILT